MILTELDDRFDIKLVCGEGRNEIGQFGDDQVGFKLMPLS